MIAFNFQTFESFRFLKWEILTNFGINFKLGFKHKMTSNLFSTFPNNLKFYNTLEIHLFLSFIPIADDHKKDITSKIN
jgi:hypothetical protein